MQTAAVQTARLCYFLLHSRALWKILVNTLLFPTLNSWKKSPGLSIIIHFKSCSSMQKHISLKITNSCYSRFDRFQAVISLFNNLNNCIYLLFNNAWHRKDKTGKLSDPSRKLKLFATPLFNIRCTQHKSYYLQLFILHHHQTFNQSLSSIQHSESVFKVKDITISNIACLAIISQFMTYLKYTSRVKLTQQSIFKL